MMTRKHFEAQAAIIKKHVATAGRDFCYELAIDLADYFERDNPRFDRGRFFKACGVDGYHLRPLPVQYVDADNPC